MKRTTALAITLLALLGACSSDKGGTASSGTTTTTAPATTATTLPPGAPTRIISLSPTATEMLFAIGAGPQVIKVDDQSNYPAGVPTSKLSGFEPNVEAIASEKPDLVVLANDTKNVKKGLEALKIKVLLAPAANTLDDTYAQLTELGTATGHPAQAATSVTAMKDGIAAAVAKVPAAVKGKTFYYELDNTLYTVTSSTFIGQLLKLTGLTNVADAADPSGTSGGYPQLSAEYLIKADPSIVFLADTKCCKQNAATFGARPGFSVLTAVKNQNVIGLDDDIASRWGPRVVNLLDALVAAEQKLAG